MNHGALVFLAAFFALSTSWYTFVLGPAMQIGRLQQTNVLGGSLSYPLARPGLAQQGEDVYRANGCFYCHSQQVRQDGTFLQVVLSDAGTNPAAASAALESLRSKVQSGRVAPPDQISKLPLVVYSGTERREMEATVKALKATGAQAGATVVSAGPDIERGWGRRRTVAEDYLYDDPAMPGSMRVGPDLANVGARLPDPAWHLRHLYAPRLEVKGSTMPPYRFLFETRRIGRRPSPDALQLPPELVQQGYEVVPRPEAAALVAYLLSLRADAPLFSAPLAVSSRPPAGTNAAPDAAASNSAPNSAQQ